MAVKITTADFVQAWHDNNGSPSVVAVALGISERAVFKRRSALEAAGHNLASLNGPGGSVKSKWAYERTQTVDFDNGVMLVYSDAHFWPGLPPTKAFRALCALASALNPKVIIGNGDLIDGARISRHPRPGWSKQPSVVDEIGELQQRQADIRRAAPRAKRFRTIGNHDARFDTFLAAHADQFDGLGGFRLADHLPDWPESWSVRVNGAVVKHRMRGGIHAGWNNLLHSQTDIITGHLHRLEAKSFRGYGARTWAVETGTLADNPQDIAPEGAGPFEYMEDGPAAWLSGFAVLTWHKGKLLRPEFCEVDSGVAYFRGQRVSC